MNLHACQHMSRLEILLFYDIFIVIKYLVFLLKYLPETSIPCGHE
jgi:hypothetical protein